MLLLFIPQHFQKFKVTKSQRPAVVFPNRFPEQPEYNFWGKTQQNLQWLWRHAVQGQQDPKKKACSLYSQLENWAQFLVSSDKAHSNFTRNARDVSEWKSTTAAAQTEALQAEQMQMPGEETTTSVIKQRWTQYWPFGDTIRDTNLFHPHSTMD